MTTPTLKQRFLALACPVLVAAGILSLTRQASAQAVPLAVSQNAFLYDSLPSTNYLLNINLQAQRGVPLTTNANQAIGSDGRAPTTAQQVANGLITAPPTTNQFRGFVTFGAIPTQGKGQTNLLPNANFAANAESLNWPRGKDSGQVVVVLRAAQVGAPYVAKAVSFSFGAVIPVPLVDASGVTLTNIQPTSYWLPAPYTTNNFTNAPYYFSPHAQAVFAIQAGQIAITWQAANPFLTQPSDYTTTNGAIVTTNFSKYVFQNGYYYPLLTVNYIVAGSAAKQPQKMYWTEGSFQKVGHTVAVPISRVNVINVIYNNSFPKRVSQAYSDPSQVPIVTTNALTETRTLWYDAQLGEIHAYNQEGRVFVELLGELHDDGYTRSFLGYEIVDVAKQVAPNDITVNLGEKIGAYQDGTDDSALTPAPLQDVTSPFYYEQSDAAISKLTLYATKETSNLNDLEVYWLINGVAGIQWPYLLNRYHEVWPSEPAKYVHYVRPLANSDAEAQLTAVQLPSQNGPVIQYQDPLDTARGKLTQTFAYYSYLVPAYPAHRALLRYTYNNAVAFQRIFSVLDTALGTPSRFAGSVATNLTGWNSTNQTLDFSGILPSAPYVTNLTVNVGDRILAPAGELGATTNYLAGYIRQTNGTSYDINAYVEPFSNAFSNANAGAIIPVNAIPNHNTLEVWWFRQDKVDVTQGFVQSYWPSVIGYYTIQWPTNANQIILASGAGSGALTSLQAKGTIYVQNDRTLPGYNPNEEHAIMLGGQAYALRDDLNVTTHTNNEYSSDAYVLVDYTETDGRPAVATFKVRREAPEQNILFDYVVEAGSPIQEPMPLPFLAQPVVGSGASAVNYNTEPSANSGDLPSGWSDATYGNGPFKNYRSFTFEDRKHGFWVYRGLHAGLPALQIGKYNNANNTFGALPAATAVLGSNFTYYIHASRRPISLVLNTITPLPLGLSAVTTTNGLAITGIPNGTVGSFLCSLSVQDNGDNAIATNALLINVVSNGIPIAQTPLAITSTNQYSGATVTYTNRPPQLAQPPTPSNCFTMRFYYRTQDGFAWPGVANPPTNGAIVPYLRPLGANGRYVGDPTAAQTKSLDIVYRPIWPAKPPTLYSGQTLTLPINNLAAVRGQSSVQVMYQQSIATNIVFQNPSVILTDPTRAKSSDLGAAGLKTLPAGVRTDSYQGRVYFPNLPPHLAQRLYFDSHIGTNGSLIYFGQFMNDLVGEKYLLPNILDGSDYTTVIKLCPVTDPKRNAWIQLVDALTTKVQTFYENPAVPGQYIPNPALDTFFNFGSAVEIKDSDSAVDSYAMSAFGPGEGYVTYVTGNGRAFTPEGASVSVYIARVAAPLWAGELKVLPSQNPLNELLTMQHTPDLGGQSFYYQYDWRIEPPVDGFPPTKPYANWNALTNGLGVSRYTLGGAGIQTLVDNYVVMRYRNTSPYADPATTNWSDWTIPQLAEGWIKRVLAGINPFNQRVTDLFNNAIATDATIIQQAGHRWEGDVALNLDTINNYGLIEIYETVLRRGENLSINNNINFGPANDALLLAAGYLSDLYVNLGNEAYADAADPTIGIGTASATLGSVATALFAFKGQEPSLLEENLALLRGRDDSLQPGVALNPVYNRLYWNYTRGIDAGEIVYALNYNILDQNGDGTVNATDAATLYPQGHGDAYGHYLTALTGYYQLLMNPNFDWVPRIEAVGVLGAVVSVDYQDERKFATAAAGVARTGQQIFDLTWREQYTPGSAGWSWFGDGRVNPRRPYSNGGATNYVTRYWGLDQWATRVGQGSYLNWVVGNALLPAVDPDPSHQGIQKVDRTTVPELPELPAFGSALQTDLNNAEAQLNPLGFSPNAIPFDINPYQVTGNNALTHFEQIYARATTALANAVVSFNDAQGVTATMRSEQTTLAAFQAAVASQELAYTNQLLALYGTPYPDDVGPGQTYKQGYNGPDLVHYMYVENPTLTFGGALPDPSKVLTFNVDTTKLPADWQTMLYTDTGFTKAKPVSFQISPLGFFGKPAVWTSQRVQPGSIQQAISDYTKAHDALIAGLSDAETARNAFDKAVKIFQAQVSVHESDRSDQQSELIFAQVALAAKTYSDISSKLTAAATKSITDVAKAVEDSIPITFIAGLAAGGDLAAPAKGAVVGAGIGANLILNAADVAAFTVSSAINFASSVFKQDVDFYNIGPRDWTLSLQTSVNNLGNTMAALQTRLVTINQRLQNLDDAKRKYDQLVAQGDRTQAERQAFRQKSAATVQGYRTRDAAFRVFRNEKLERYKSLFSLAAEYSYLAAQAYDYETGLLNTPQGRSFLNRIISAQALGVVSGGQPQYAGSDTGDPGLSSALAEMKADFDVLKGRLGFNNPDGYGTLTSLRTENFRILSSADGNKNWTDVLNQHRVTDILSDQDVQRYCLQVNDGSGLPVPGIILDFSTVIANGLNLFGQPLAAGDHDFTASSFATKIFAVGVDFDGYIGMDSPTGAASPGDPTTDPNGLAATPYVYLIPVGVDSMRSPPLGDSSTVRTWTVDDLTIPLPFNISAADFSSAPNYTAANSLSEPLYSIRKHQAFRPVSAASVFTPAAFASGGSLTKTSFTNSRLIGRSVWNSHWKLVIPGRTLLNDPNAGLDRFIKSVRDIKLYFVTYSYSGN